MQLGEMEKIDIIIHPQHSITVAEAKGITEEFGTHQKINKEDEEKGQMLT